jgi:hypothetical protein
MTAPRFLSSPHVAERFARRVSEELAQPEASLTTRSYEAVFRAVRTIGAPRPGESQAPSDARIEREIA